jgi:uncharacterized membrane protein (DUF373 family)
VLSVIGIMMGMYILTRMLYIVVEEKVSGITRLFAIATMLIALGGMAYLFVGPSLTSSLNN